MITFSIFFGWFFLNALFVHIVDRNSTHRHALMISGYLGILIACITVLLLDKYSDEEMVALEFLKNFVMVFGAAVHGNFIVHAALTTSDKVYEK